MGINTVHNTAATSSSGRSSSINTGNMRPVSEKAAGRKMKVILFVGLFAIAVIFFEDSSLGLKVSKSSSYAAAVDYDDDIAGLASRSSAGAVDDDDDDDDDIPNIGADADADDGDVRENGDAADDADGAAAADDDDDETKVVDGSTSSNENGNDKDGGEEKLSTDANTDNGNDDHGNDQIEKKPITDISNNVTDTNTDSADNKNIISDKEDKNSTNTTDAATDIGAGTIVIGIDNSTNSNTTEKEPEHEPLGPHPHAGARYPDGRYGYVADVTAVRRQHFQMLEDWRKDNGINTSTNDDGNDGADGTALLSPSSSDADGLNLGLGLHPEQDRNGDTFDSYQMKRTFDIDIFDYACERPIGEGWEAPKGFELMQKIKIGGPPPQLDPVPENVTLSLNATTTSSIISNSNNAENSTATEIRRKLRGSNSTDNHGEVQDQDLDLDQVRAKPRLLCVVYTYDKHHETMLQAVVNTWAWKCDGFFAASTITNETLGAVDLPHVGDEAYNNMWQKTRSIWGYIHDNYLDDYDYFWLGGDDYGLIVENLRAVVEDNALEANPEGANENGIPVYMGHQIPSHGGTWFCGGGAGYILNQVTVKRLIAEVLPTCAATKIISSEDRFLSNCLRGIGIICGKTNDINGRDRMPGMDPAFMATFKGDRGYFKNVYEFWGRQNGGFRWGLDFVSEQGIGFHNLRYPAFMHRIHALQYPGICPSNSTIGNSTIGKS
mmetsp:Transcript_23433/g.34751  ORF Transcript_23433/g.34751 Transcript_23433/m.34751 type:complete len:721 (+) Transcript_23433:212-2374(+)